MTTEKVSVYGVQFDARGRVLLVKDTHSLLWGFPGGGVEKAETHEDAVRREFLEETGLHIYGKLIFVTQQQDSIKRRFFYKVQQVKGHVRANGNEHDILCAAYFDVEQLPFSELVPGVKRIIYDLN